MRAKLTFSLVLALAAIIALVTLPACTSEEPVEAYPTHSITLVIPSDAGGGFDLLGRALVSIAEPYLGRSLVPVLKPGGAGQSVGAGYVAQQPADGYTWLLTNRQFLVLALTETDLPYKVEDFTSLGMITNEPLFIIVSATSPYKTLADLVQAAKAKPGEITVGTVGQYGLQHLVFEQLAKRAGVKWNYVPQPGGGQANAAVVGGHNDATVAVPTTAATLLSAGQVRILAITSENRATFAPFDKAGIPTLKEQGYDFSLNNYMALFVRSATPAPIMEKARASVQQMMGDASLKVLLQKMAAIQEYRPGPETDALIANDIAAVKNIMQ